MKKGFRELTAEEKKFTEKNLDGARAEMEHLKLMIKYNSFMLDDMLLSNYLEKRRGFVKQTQEFESEVKQLQNTIENTEKQLKDGVEVKEEVSSIPSMTE